MCFENEETDIMTEFRIHREHRNKLMQSSAAEIAKAFINTRVDIPDLAAKLNQYSYSTHKEIMRYVIEYFFTDAIQNNELFTSEDVAIRFSQILSLARDMIMLKELINDAFFSGLLFGIEIESTDLLVGIDLIEERGQYLGYWSTFHLENQNPGDLIDINYVRNKIQRQDKIDRVHEVLDYYEEHPNYMRTFTLRPDFFLIQVIPGNEFDIDIESGLLNLPEQKYETLDTIRDEQIEYIDLVAYFRNLNGVLQNVNEGIERIDGRTGIINDILQNVHNKLYQKPTQVALLILFLGLMASVGTLVAYSFAYSNDKSKVNFTRVLSSAIGVFAALIGLIVGFKAQCFKDNKTCWNSNATWASLFCLKEKITEDNDRNLTANLL